MANKDVHINSITFIVSRTLLSLYYQVKLLQRTQAYVMYILTEYMLMINYFFTLIAASRGFTCYLHGFLVFFAHAYACIMLYTKCCHIAKGGEFALP